MTTIFRLWLWLFDSYRTGCRNVSHCQQQQSHSGLRSSGRSNSTYVWNDSWVQTFHSLSLLFKCLSTMQQRKAQKSIQYMIIQIQDRRGADSRHYWNRTEITVLVCVCVCVKKKKLLFGYGFNAGARAIRCTVDIGLNTSGAFWLAFVSVISVAILLVK